MARAVGIVCDCFLYDLGMVVYVLFPSRDDLRDDAEAVAGRSLGKDRTVSALLNFILEEAPFGDRHGRGFRPVALPRCVRHNFLLSILALVRIVMTTSSCRRQFVKTLSSLSSTPLSAVPSTRWIAHRSFGHPIPKGRSRRPRPLWNANSFSKNLIQLNYRMCCVFFASARIPMVGSFPCCAPGERLSRRRAT